MTQERRIAIAMSGGVDSSVAAALLAEREQQVFGIMMRLWSAGPGRPNRCCSPTDMAAARRIADQLGIPFYVVDMRQRFKREVVDIFIDGYAQGITPNPCIECNRRIRWEALLQHALSLGATHLATGHYARLQVRNGGHRLLRAKDPAKDQSYVLSVLGQYELAHAMFPLGEYTKGEVRRIARERMFSVAERPESQDLCFVGGRDYRDFLRRFGNVPPSPGAITDQEGNVLGTHQGLFAYTIGQRKGIGLSAPHPLYVLAKDPEANTLIVGPREALGVQDFALEKVHWVAGVPPATDEALVVQIRYKAPLAPCRIEVESSDRRAQVYLAEPLPDVTPGQAAVFYRGDTCLGAGIIAA